GTRQRGHRDRRSQPAVPDGPGRVDRVRPQPGGAAGPPDPRRRTAHRPRGLDPGRGGGDPPGPRGQPGGRRAARLAHLRRNLVSTDLFIAVTVFVLSLLVGFEVISKVPATLHTPLMSGANAIHGIVLIGAMLVAATVDNVIGYALAFAAVMFGAANVVGGYVVTDRMLHMFRARPKERD